MKYIRHISPQIDDEDVTVMFEIESKSEIDHDSKLKYFEKGILKRSEIRNDLSKNTTLEMDETDMADTPPITSVTPTNDMRTSQPSPAAAGMTPQQQQSELEKLQQQMAEMKTEMMELISTKIPKPRGRPKIKQD